MFLKEFRERINLTQKELSEKIDVAQTTIARYEKKQINPTSIILEKYINILDANPNFLFLKMEPATLDDYPVFDEVTLNLLKDIVITIPNSEINSKLNEILIDEILKRFVDSKSNIFTKILSFVSLQGVFKSRPILFLYYIFQMIEKDKNSKSVKSYKEYLKDIIENYKTLSFKNQPIFTDSMKNSIVDIIDIKLTESECRLLVEKNKETLNIIELNMPPHLVKFHRNLFNS
ncbi:helix-turn-helix domain-containing protein [Arcobacter sp. YIC-464]|uniref:helix-turn-helix domain-containing protein n=1 Tax=Arcobacter sp. YIC-464 TaxID=3376631 RepID=UPI003C14DDC3